jgi:hypothetical protein
MFALRFLYTESQRVDLLKAQIIIPGYDAQGIILDDGRHATPYTISSSEIEFKSST